MNGDSLQRIFLGTLRGRERAIAFMTYAKSRLSHRNKEADVRFLDSLMQIHVKEADLIADYDAMIADVRSLAEGSLAPDIELPDHNGVLRRLSELRGKPVLIDFWGTWCPPCLEELPFVDSLARDYAHTDLGILSVALEYKQVAYWKKFIQDRQLPGMHLYAEAQFNNEQVQKYRVDASGVPSYFLIDREGRIVMANSLRPSNPKLRSLIDNILNTPAN